MNISISYNVNAITRDLSGKTVGEIRSLCAEGLDIPSDAVAKVAGTEVGESTIVEAGQSLVFVKKAGDKGC